MYIYIYIQIISWIFQGQTGTFSIDLTVTAIYLYRGSVAATGTSNSKWHVKSGKLENLRTIEHRCESNTFHIAMIWCIIDSGGKSILSHYDIVSNHQITCLWNRQEVSGKYQYLKQQRANGLQYLQVNFQYQDIETSVFQRNAHFYL